MSETSKKDRIARRRRIRAKILGTAERPRVSVYRSNTRMHLQMIDDMAGKTLLAFSSPKKSGATVAAAGQLGEAASKAALAADIKQVVFDRGGFLYHGRVKAVAEGLRKGGLKL